MAGALGKLIPLILLFAFVGVFAWVGYQMYVFSNDLASRGKKHMEKKNINFSKGGMRVGVKGRSEEESADRQQSVLVKTWNLSSFPNYKSMWNTGGADGAQDPAAARPGNSRTTSRTGKGDKVG